MIRPSCVRDSRALATLDDRRRIEAVEDTGLLDTPPEAAFDRLASLAARVLDVPIAMITMVDGTRTFVKSNVGLPEGGPIGRELPVSDSLCAFVVASKTPLAIEDGQADELYAQHPAIKSLGVRAYLGVPLIGPPGEVLGTLCAVDTQPRTWRTDAIEILSQVAESVVAEIELRKHMNQVSSAYDNLLSEHTTLVDYTQYVDALLESGADMLSILDASGKIIYASPSTTEILGYEPRELVGMSAFANIHPRDRGAVIASFERIFGLPDVGVPIAYRFRHACGKWRYLESIGTNHLNTPSIQGIVINTRDISDRKRMETQLARQNRDLERLLANRTEELDEARFEILTRLALAAEFRDDVTGQHTRRVGQLSARIAEFLDYSALNVSYVERSAPLHDVGKIGIPDQILLKPGSLTREERATMEQHTLIGSRLVSGSDVACLQMAEEIAVSHHERWDGLGYPHGLKGDEIPQIGRIVAVADVLDALTHNRPYKSAWPLDAAIGEVASQRGKQFDPVIVDVLLTLYHDHLRGSQTLADFESGKHEADSSLHSAQASLLVGAWS